MKKAQRHRGRRHIGTETEMKKNEGSRVFGNFISAPEDCSVPTSEHFVPMCLCSFVPTVKVIQ